MTPNTAAEALLYSTVKLVTSRAGVPTGTGTGFFYRVDLGSGRVSVVLITNKHVIEGADQVVAVCHLSHLNGQVVDGRPGPSGELANCVVDIASGDVVMHPDPDVDLCGVPINGCLQNATARGQSIFFMAMTREDIPKPEDWSNFDAIEEVTMIGCPRGLFDEVNNLPLVRRGITATPLSVSYNGKNEFMVDMACFPGSSGSPVVVYDRNGYLDRKTNTYKLGTQRVALVGVLYSGPLITTSGEIILGHAPRVEVASMMHLGHVIRSTAILTIEARLRELAMASL